MLVATDCLSEGVNLQDAFSAVVHYDLAWNPTRHEQREGRVDRFGQRRDTVRAVTLYGRDNSIDGIVLDVLLRKHEAIRQATGVSVPVPDESDTVMEAVLEGLLLRSRDPEQLAFDGLATGKRQALHAEWESAAERERQSRTKYAQAGIHPEEVARELAEIRAALGTHGEVDGFVREALSALGATVTTTSDGFRGAIGSPPSPSRRWATRTSPSSTGASRAGRRPDCRPTSMSTPASDLSLAGAAWWGCTARSCDWLKGVAMVDGTQKAAPEPAIPRCSSSGCSRPLGSVGDRAPRALAAGTEAWRGGWRYGAAVTHW